MEQVLRICTVIAAGLLDLLLLITLAVYFFSRPGSGERAKRRLRELFSRAAHNERK